MYKKEFEERIIKIEANLLEQEHRPFILIWNFITRKKKYESDDPRRLAISKAIIWRLLFSPTTIAITFTTLIALITLFFLYKQTLILESQNKLINQQTKLTEATRRSSQVVLLNGVLKDINVELNNSKDSISNNLSARIISLSHTIKPYKYYQYETENISGLLSPERTQLLYSIVSSDINEKILSENIFKYANFRYSDLSNQRLINRFFKNIDLRYSTLDKALLHKSNLINSDLRNTSIIDAGMPNVKLNRADLRDSFLKSVFLSEAIMDSCDLRKTIFTDMNMGEIESLNHSIVHRHDWFYYLDSLNNTGLEKLRSKYKIENVFYNNIQDTLFTIVLK